MAEELEKIDKDPARSTIKYMSIRGELEAYEKDKCKGAIIRSRAQYAVEGEKCTAFFLGLEKKKQSRTYLEEIENEKGEVVSDYVGVLETVQDFYGNLFKKGSVDENSVGEVLGTVEHSLGNSDRDMCDRDLAEDEILVAIKSLNNGKSPGSDGLPGEFYKCFKGLLGPIMLRVYREMERTGQVSESMATGLITILYKNKGSKRSLGNYRGISLLNTYYKILAKVLAESIFLCGAFCVPSTKMFVFCLDLDKY